MEPSPAHVIRTVRQALKMSQGQFAKALGWAPSTISRWERGDAMPNRLALKTILAFAEERKVRYRPRNATTNASATRALVPVVLEGPEREPAFPTAVGPRDPDHGDPFVSLTARRPRWAAEARFRFAMSPGPVGRQPVTTTLRNAAIVAASFGAVLTIGLRGWQVEGPAAPAPAVTIAKVHSAASGAVAEEAEMALAEDEALMLEDEYAATTDSRLEPAPASIARLESIVMIGQAGRATFRTHADAVTVTEGSTLGDRRVRRISGDRVELVDDTGTARSVRIGDPLPPG
jgi:transcriptional regulator with XRE-family HTH domain